MKTLESVVAGEAERPHQTSGVVPAKAGTHMWTAPVAQELFERIDRWHPYVRPVDAIVVIAGQDGLRDTSSKHPRDLLAANGSHGLSPIVVDQLLHLLLQLPGRPVSELPVGPIRVRRRAPVRPSSAPRRNFGLSP